MKPDWQTPDGSIRLYCADCRDVLAALRAGSIDAVVTDPPYGVNLGNHAAAKKSPGGLAKKGYLSYDDTPENYETQIVPRIRMAVRLANRALVFAAGTQMWSLPRPDAVGGVFLPAGCGRHSWGFNCHAHFVLYGKSPDMASGGGCRPTGWSSTDGADKSEHPCPKPVKWMERCVALASRERDVVLDPFMGSGTTGVACIRTGRRFIGVELEPKYFEIAVKRIKDELAKPSLISPAKSWRANADFGLVVTRHGKKRNSDGGQMRQRRL